MLTLNMHTKLDSRSKLSPYHQLVEDGGLFFRGASSNFLLSHYRPEANSRCCTYSPDGGYFAWACNEEYVSAGICVALWGLIVFD